MVTLYSAQALHYFGFSSQSDGRLEELEEIESLIPLVSEKIDKHALCKLLSQAENVKSPKNLLQQWVNRVVTTEYEDRVQTVYCRIQAVFTSHLSSMDGQLWQCVGRSCGDGQGHIYHYKLFDKYDVIQGKSLRQQVDYIVQSVEIWPSIEPGVESISEQARQRQQEQEKKLEPFGYAFKRSEADYVLSFPDEQQIIESFEKLKIGHPNRKTPTIATGLHIIRHLQFVEAFLNYDLIISEPVHDHFAHNEPILEMMSCCYDEYIQERERHRQLVRPAYERMMFIKEELEKDLTDSIPGDLRCHLPKMEISLGAAVDHLWALPTIQEMKNVSAEYFDTQSSRFLENITHVQFKKAWEKEFAEPANHDFLALLWNQITELEKTLRSQ